MIGRLLRPALGRPAAVAGSLPSGVEVRVGRWLPTLAGRLAGMRSHAAAVTVGDTIVVHPEVTLSEALVRHELAHVRQWRALPWTFVVRYAAAHLRHGYRDNPYEVEARKAETGDAGG